MVLSEGGFRVAGVSISTYVNFKVFSLFRDRLLPTINGYRKDEKDSDLYRHIFLAPESYSKKRVFQVKGVLTPYCCLWATSPLKFSKDFYSRSVLPVDFAYKNKEEKDVVERGFLYDYEQTFEFSSGSYFKDFSGQVNQDLLDMDRLRYFYINVDELLFGYTSVCELTLNDLVPSESVDQESGNRSFNLGGKYTLRITLPILSKGDYLNGVKVFLNEHTFYEREVEEVGSSVPPDNPGVMWEHE
jgi:hypothetical protein